jgi:phospholipase/carboxylesterase
MEHDTILERLFAVLDRLANIARMMHPRRLEALIATLDDLDMQLEAALTGYGGSLSPAATFALQACCGLRAASEADNPVLQSYRAMRHYSRSLEALAPLAETVPAISRFFLEPRFRDDPNALQRLAGQPNADTGVFHFCNETNQRGGFSVFVPSWYDSATPAPVIMALHGGSGHGRLFLWNWLAEARSRGLIVIGPTAIGSTWSLMEPEIDSDNLETILTKTRERWNVDPRHMLLSGMSDGGTFTLLSGLADDSSFTHLAPAAASFHPFLLTMTSPVRLTGLPIHLTHGAQDWMFPVDMARTAYRTLASAGARITYREIADLSHAYPRDGQGEVMDWWLDTPSD